MSDDKGHKLLLRDLDALLSEARAYQFHDFKNTNYPTPKIALHRRLGVIQEKIKAGDYDNDAPDG